MSRQEDNTKSKVIIINGRRFIDESVIEDIKNGIHEEIRDNGGWYERREEDAIKKFDEIIDRRVNEATHEQKN